MLFHDCLLLNTDRHLSNIEFLYDTFDKNDYKASDGRTFEELYKLVTQYKSYENEL